jgi:anti-anti-sigma factor
VLNASLRMRSDRDVIVAGVAGEIDHSNAGDLLATTTARLTNDVLGLVLDFTDATYLDSAAINVIFVLRERLSSRGQHLGLVMLPDAAPHDALSLAGVLDTVTISETADSAVSGICDAAAA